MAVKKPKAVEEIEEVNEAVKVEKTEETLAETVRKETEKTDSFFVYLGPTILGVIQKASIWAGDRKEVLRKLDAAITKYPRIKSLLVSGDTLANDRNEISRPGTRLNAEYQRLVNELKKQ